MWWRASSHIWKYFFLYFRKCYDYFLIFILYYVYLQKAIVFLFWAHFWGKKCVARLKKTKKKIKKKRLFLVSFQLSRKFPYKVYGKICRCPSLTNNKLTQAERAPSFPLHTDIALSASANRMPGSFLRWANNTNTSGTVRTFLRKEMSDTAELLLAFSGRSMLFMCDICYICCKKLWFRVEINVLVVVG